MANYTAMQDSSAPRKPVANRDPFYVVKEKVQGIVGKLSGDFDQWRDLFENTNTANNKQFSQLGQQIQMDLRTVNVDIKDLAQTVTIVESHRSRFPNIDDAELASRTKFVNDMKAMSGEIEETMNSSRTKRKLEQDSREALLGSSGGAGRGRMAGGGDDFVTNKKEQQIQLQQQQDLVLDDMSSALSRLGGVSSSIQSELQTHHELLGEMDEEMDEAQGNMGVVLGKLDKLLGKSDKCRWTCIFLLLVTAIVLMFLIVYL